MELTREQKLNQLSNVEREVERLKQELGFSSGAAGGDVEATAEKRDQDAALWDKLSPAERTDLYVNSRERWQELIAAKEAAGMRKLLNGRSVL
jgi:hypothetical protein